MKSRLIFPLIFVAVWATACQSLDPNWTASLPTPAPPLQPTTGVALEPEGFIKRIHDPVMAKEGDSYYVFSTGSRIIIICSPDMVQWEFCGRVFDRNPAWVTEAVPGVGDLWAPDIAYFGGKWHLYYAGSTFGSNRSVIGLATNVTLDPNRPDYAWVDEGLVIGSQPSNNWNAIDANVAFDADDQPWLAFGSYWSGLKLRKLDAATGKLAADDDMLYPLAQRFEANGSIEAPFIIRRSEYYYLFASFDYCCRGADSTYNVRVGRAAEITGPYVDRDGKPMLEGGGTRILAAYDRWAGPGHNGIYVADGTYWIVYHAYDAKQVGIPKLRIESLGWDAEGWPVVPSQTEGAE
ncbi:MAG: arabinan endo-1,5-alpha-L-arabinosidase [Caldilineaceae bacterium]